MKVMKVYPNEEGKDDSSDIWTFLMQVPNFLILHRLQEL
jgi:hypothetical protein